MQCPKNFASKNGVLSRFLSRGDNDDNDVYFTLATSDGGIGKYKTVGEQLTHKNRSIYNAIWIIKRDYVGMVESWIS